MTLFEKMKGAGAPRQPRTNAIEVASAWIGSAIAIGLIGLLDTYVTGPQAIPMLIGSFGASAVLVFGAISSPLAQPRNLLGGHFVSALIGVTCAMLFPETTWLAAGLAVSTAIACMLVTGTLHPPGGATALIAVVGGPGVWNLGYWYALVPCLGGALIMLAVGLVTNNIPKGRRYPQRWC